MNPPSLLRVALPWAGVVLAGASSAALTPEQVAQLPPPAAQTIRFSRDIKPIFEKSCLQCHGHGRAKGGFRIDSRETVLAGGDSGPAVLPGQSAKSLFIELVMGFDPDSQMPKKGTKLTREQIGLLRAWIDQGAPWDEGVSFAKAEPRNFQPRRPPLPPARTRGSHPVDRLLAGYFAEKAFRRTGWWTIAPSPGGCIWTWWVCCCRRRS